MLTPNEKKTLALVAAAHPASFKPSGVGRKALNQEKALSRLQAYGYVEPGSEPWPLTRYTITSLGGMALL